MSKYILSLSPALDWPGSEDVITLGRIYFDALRALVADGQGKGFLS
jgi:hypothetical protein